MRWTYSSRQSTQLILDGRQALASFKSTIKIMVRDKNVMKQFLLKFKVRSSLEQKSKNLEKKMTNNSYRLLIQLKNGGKSIHKHNRYQMIRFQKDMILETLMVMTSLDLSKIRASVVHATPSRLQELSKPGSSSNMERKFQTFHHNKSCSVIS